MDVHFPCGVAVLLLPFRFLMSCVTRVRDYVRGGQEARVVDLPLRPEQPDVAVEEEVGLPPLPRRPAEADDLPPYEPPVTRSVTRRRALMRPVTRTSSQRSEPKRPPFSCCRDEDN